MAGIQTFFETNDIELRWKKIHRLFPAKIKKTGGKIWTIEDIQIMVSSVRNLRQKAIIHFLAASGVRRGAIPDLKLKHLKEMRHGYRSVLVYEGSLEEYTTFIHALDVTRSDKIPQIQNEAFASLKSRLALSKGSFVFEAPPRGQVIEQERIDLGLLFDVYYGTKFTESNQSWFKENMFRTSDGATEFFGGLIK